MKLVLDSDRGTGIQSFQVEIVFYTLCSYGLRDVINHHFRHWNGNHSSQTGSGVPEKGVAILLLEERVFVISTVVNQEGREQRQVRYDQNMQTLNMAIMWLRLLHYGDKLIIYFVNVRNS